MDLPTQGTSTGSSIQSGDAPPAIQATPSEEQNEMMLSSWDLRRKRFEMFCGSGRLSPSRFGAAWKRQQLLTEKATIVVLSLVVCETLAVNGSTYIFGSFLDALFEKDGVKSYHQFYSTFLLQTYGFSYASLLLYPIAGWLGDSKVGRHKMAVISLLILFVSLVLVAFYFSFYQYRVSEESKMAMTVIFYFAICLGAAGFSSNIIPFGADQLLYGPAEQVTSYFNWLYWARQVGRLMLTISFVNGSTDERALIASFVASLLTAVALILNMSFKKCLFIENERRNPLKQIFDVLRFAAVAKRPERVSAFGFDGRSSPSRVDLAKSKHGGHFESNVVDDVKTFLSLLPLLLLFGVPYFFLLGNQISLSFQAARMYHNMPAGIADHDSMQLRITVITSMVSITLTPIMDQLIFPFLRDFTPSTLKRVGIGFASLVLASFVSMIYEAANYQLHHSNYQCTFSVDTDASNSTLSVPFWWILLPFFFICLAEMLISTSSYEFFYTQSPHGMRGMMIGLLIFSKGLIGGLYAAFLTAFIAEGGSTKQEPCRIWYYLIMLVTTGIAFVIYAMATTKYKRRTRAGMEDSGRFYLI